MQAVDTIKASLNRAWLRVGHEGELQEDLDALFRCLFPDLLREYWLSTHDRVDFYVPSEKIGVECKLARSGGNLGSVTRQLRRYMESDRISCLVVITTSYYLVSKIPKEILGKQIYCVNVGGAF